MKLTVTGFNSNSYIYAVRANAYQVSTDGMQCYTKSFEAYRGIGATFSSLVASAKPDSGYTFEYSSQFNNGQLMRGSRIDLSDLVTLYSFSYPI